MSKTEPQSRAKKAPIKGAKAVAVSERAVARKSIAPRPKPAAKKTIATPTDETVTVRIVQGNSPTFTDDLLAVFRANVREARRKNAAVAQKPKRAAKRA